MTRFSRDQDPQVGPPVERSGSQDWPETRFTRVKRHRPKRGRDHDVTDRRRQTLLNISLA